MTTDTTTTSHTDRLAAGIAAMRQLAAADLDFIKDTLQAEARPGSLPYPSVLEHAYAGAFLSELGYVENHESTRLWKIQANALQATHRFILAMNEKNKTDLTTLAHGSDERDELKMMIRVRSRALYELVTVIRARTSSKRRW